MSLHLIGFGTQAVGLFIDIQAGKEVINGLSTHLGDELVRIVLREILVLNRNHFHKVEVFFLSEEFELRHLTAFVVIRDGLAFQDASLNHHIAFIIDDSVKFLGRDTKQGTNLVGQRTEIPDMGDGHHQ